MMVKGMTNYEVHKKYMREQSARGGRFYHLQRARTEAIRILIKKHRREYDKIYFKLKKELGEELK